MMTKLEKLELEVAKLRSNVEELTLKVNNVGSMRSITELLGMFRDDPEMKAQLAAERDERERQRQREFAEIDRRAQVPDDRRKPTTRKKKVA